MRRATNADFSAAVQRHFGFLLDLGYTRTEDAWHPSSASYIVRYERPDRAVELIWGRKDQQFYFRVKNLRLTGGASWFYVFQLAEAVDPRGDWGFRLDIGAGLDGPTADHLDARVRANAEVLRLHGQDGLVGRTWPGDLYS